eukprot:Protomagalhaensia_sp_Gyna_25__2253@NODE_222_length_4314_cov_33_908070_g173_i0_p7_GENE_NODE_222_length_4314_cov_33_908070_g173_i0NODE_222_length_4314_cov_33_908070_g173_i0_p7_ORF_typecomplete_len114_score12_36SCRG1/PF15224_6/0_18_NODE_222_length_4314_cov_33_908070_g173_i023102651
MVALFAVQVAQFDPFRKGMEAAYHPFFSFASTYASYCSFLRLLCCPWRLKVVFPFQLLVRFKRLSILFPRFETLYGQVRLRRYSAATTTRSTTPSQVRLERLDIKRHPLDDGV